MVDFQVQGNVGVADAGKIVPRLLLSEFADKYDLVTRTQLEALLAEKDLQMADLMAPDGAARLGKFLPVRYLVVGEVTKGADYFITARLVEVGPGLIRSPRKVSAGTYRDLEGRIPLLGKLLSMSDAEYRERPEEPVPVSTQSTKGPAKVGTKPPAVLKVPPGFLAKEGTTAESYTRTGWAKEIVHEGTGMELVFIRAGEFDMGSGAKTVGHREDEGPVRHVKISRPFYMGKYEVTQGQWRKIMGTNPSQSGTEDRMPVDSVSAVGCQEFLKKAGAGMRLPTEAEWEYACRSGRKEERFSYGNEPSVLEDYANYLDGMVTRLEPRRTEREDGFEKVAPVGSYKPTTWGLYDMNGNVYEWCQDWYDKDYYSQGAIMDPTGPATGVMRVVRGGSWATVGARCGNACRLGRRHDVPFPDGGFRVVVPVPVEPEP